jgi:hypothetical protein
MTLQGDYSTKRFQDRNPKAFSFANPGRLQKTAARSHDVCSDPKNPGYRNTKQEDLI